MRTLPVVALLLVFTRWAGAGDAPLELVGRITLPGVTGRIDHMALDAGRKRLFIAALGNNSLEVVDLRAAKRVRSIPGLDEPQGVVFIAGPDRVVVANGGDGACLVFDAGTPEGYS